MEKRVGFPALFFSFLKTGLMAFGGGYTMLLLLQRELVERRRYLDEKDFWETVTLVQSLPGVLVFNMALYTGYKLRGLKGGMVACAGAILPSVVVILLIATIFSSYWENPVLVKIFHGVRPCVIALLLAAALRMAMTVGLNVKNVLVALAVVGCIIALHISPIYVLLIVGLASGFWAYYKAQRLKATERGSDGSGCAAGADHTADSAADPRGKEDGER